MDRLPKDGIFASARRPAVAETRAGLALFRDLAAGGMLLH